MHGTLNVKFTNVGFLNEGQQIPNVGFSIEDKLNGTN
jgi:hypothetical protein